MEEEFKTAMKVTLLINVTEREQQPPSDQETQKEESDRGKKNRSLKRRQSVR